MDKLKPCEKCGGTNLSKRLIAVRCLDCGHLEYLNEWNRRAMPECVRKLRDTALDAAFKLAGDGDTDISDDVRDAANAVTEYYGEGGE